MSEESHLPLNNLELLWDKKKKNNLELQLFSWHTSTIMEESEESIPLLWKVRIHLYAEECLSKDLVDSTCKALQMD